MLNQKIKNDCGAAELKKQLDDNTKDKMLSILQNAEKPVTREELSKRLNIPDRTVRKHKEQLILEGHRIGSSSQKAGYILNDESMCKKAAKEYRARALKDLRIAMILEGYDPNQISMEELL